MKVITVLKTGGDFDAEYVNRIRDKIPSQFQFVCLSDDEHVIDRIPLKYDYGNKKGWWSKLEMFRPDIIDDDIFYVDLDTVIIGDITKEMEQISRVDKPIMLSDFYFPEQLASGIMFFPNRYRKVVWEEWLHQTPTNVMKSNRGDQNFIGGVVQSDSLRFNEFIPDLICSYKVHVRKNNPSRVKPYDVDTTKSKIVCFHGKPRPKDVGWKVALSR